MVEYDPDTHGSSLRRDEQEAIGGLAHEKALWESHEVGDLLGLMFARDVELAAERPALDTQEWWENWKARGIVANALLEMRRVLPEDVYNKYAPKPEASDEKTAGVLVEFATKRKLTKDGGRLPREVSNF